MDTSRNTAERPARAGTMRHLVPCRHCGAVNGLSAATCWDCEVGLQTLHGAWLDTLSPQAQQVADEAMLAGAGSTDGYPAGGLPVDSPRPTAMNAAPAMQAAAGQWPMAYTTQGPLPATRAHRSAASPRRGKRGRVPAALAGWGVIVTAGLVTVALWPASSPRGPVTVSTAGVDASVAVASGVPAPLAGAALSAASAALALNLESLESLAATGAGVSARPSRVPAGSAARPDPLAAPAVAGTCTANVVALGLCTPIPPTVEGGP